MCLINVCVSLCVYLHNETDNMVYVGISLRMRNREAGWGLSTCHFSVKVVNQLRLAALTHGGVYLQFLY